MNERLEAVANAVLGEAWGPVLFEAFRAYDAAAHPSDTQQEGRAHGAVSEGGAIPADPPTPAHIGALADDDKPNYSLNDIRSYGSRYIAALEAARDSIKAASEVHDRIVIKVTDGEMQALKRAWDGLDAALAQITAALEAQPAPALSITAEELEEVIVREAAKYGAYYPIKAAHAVLAELRRRGVFP